MNDFIYLFKNEINSWRFKIAFYIVLSGCVLSYILSFMRIFIFNEPSSFFSNSYSPLTNFLSKVNIVIPVFFTQSIVYEYKTKISYQILSLPCRRYIFPLARFTAYSALLFIHPVLSDIIGIFLALLILWAGSYIILYEKYEYIK